MRNYHARGVQFGTIFRRFSAINVLPRCERAVRQHAFDRTLIHPEAGVVVFSAQFNSSILFHFESLWPEDIKLSSAYSYLPGAACATVGSEGVRRGREQPVSSHTGYGECKVHLVHNRFMFMSYV